MKEDLDPRIKQILDHYGIKHQLGKLTEECRECANAAYRMQLAEKTASTGALDEMSFTKDLNHLADELADVSIMMDQVVFGYDIFELVAQRREFKLNRQLERIRREEGKKHERS